MRERERKPDLSSPGCSILSLIHVRVELPLIPSCTDVEQVRVRDSPAMTKLLEWNMLIVGKGAVGGGRT